MAFKYQVKRGSSPSTEDTVSKIVDGEFFFDKTRNIMYVGNTDDTDGFVKIGSKGESISVYNAFTHDERGIVSTGTAIVPYVVINDVRSEGSIDIGTSEKPFNAVYSTNVLADIVEASTSVSAEHIYGTIMCESADWAEYFEWADGNPDNEDRRGLAVSLNTEGKIELASKSDHVIGVVSSKPLVTGDNYDSHWQGKYQKDLYGSFILDENGDKIISEDFDDKLTYIPRKNRKEWSPIALLGKVVLRDDGSCQVSGYASVFEDGVVTSSEDGLLVIKRIDETHILVLLH